MSARPRTFGTRLAAGLVGALALTVALPGIADAAPRTSAPTFTSQPPSLTSSTTATFTWTGPSGSTTYYDKTQQCALDSGAYAPCSYTVTFSNLLDGKHTAHFRMQHTGRRLSTTTKTWTVDTVPPPAPTLSQPPTPTSTKAVSISIADTESGVTFTCALDSGTAAACTSPYSKTGLADGVHTLVVTAKDKAGNTAASQVSWTVDSTAPAAVVVTPPPSPTNDPTAQVYFVDSSPDVTHYTCAIDTHLAVACTSPWTPNFPPVQGTNTVVIIAYDAANNASDSGSADWVFDNVAPPAPFVLDGPADPTNQTSASIDFSDSEPTSTFECRFDSSNDADWASCTSPFTVDSLSNATHTLELRATDGADNTSTATSYSWTVNSSLVYEPVTFASGPADPSNDTNPSFDFGVSDGNTSVTGYTCSLDSAAFTACDPTTGPVAVDLSTAADGLHSFAVIAHYGGTSSATAVYKWHLDTVAPATPSVDPVASPSQAAAVTFSDTDSDVATFTCQIDALAPVSCASPFTVTAAGTHTVAVSATDYAGNTSAPATSNSFVVKTSTTAPTFTGSADKFKTHAVSLSVQATEAGDTLSCALDSGTPVDCTGGTFEATTSDGNHTLHATATDGVGNKASSAFPFLVKTSTTAPTVASSDPATFHVHTVVLHVASTDPGDTLACSLDGAAATDCTGGVWTGTVADGVHHLTVTAKDALGNTASTVRAFTVDTSLSGGVDDPGYGNLVGSVASWTTVKAKGTYGGSYIEQRNAGASVTVAFAGPSVTWYTVTGPDQGVAKVYIDGKSHGSVNDYATKRHTKVAHTITGLKKGAHKLRIVVAGKKGAKTATDQLVSLDAVKVGKKVLSTPKVTAFWRFLTVSGVSVPTTDLAGSALAATFSGTSVTWFDLVGPTAGKVTAFVDGVNRGVFDDHAATVAATAHSVTGLSAGVHVIKLVTSPGTKKGAFVSIVAIRAK